MGAAAPAGGARVRRVVPTEGGLRQGASSPRCWRRGWARPPTRARWPPPASAPCAEPWRPARESFRASQGPLTPQLARPGEQRTLGFGSASSVIVPCAGSPPGDDKEETPGDVRSLLMEFERLDVDASEQQLLAPGGARQSKRIRL